MRKKKILRSIPSTSYMYTSCSHHLIVLLTLIKPRIQNKSSLLGGCKLSVDQMKLHTSPTKLARVGLSLQDPAGLLAVYIHVRPLSLKGYIKLMTNVPLTDKLFVLQIRKYTT